MPKLVVTEAIKRRIVALHARRLTDAAIGRRLGLGKMQATYLRQRVLGLAAHGRGNWAGSGVEAVERRHGCKPGEFRAARQRRRACDAGWPCGCTPAVAAALACLEGGPAVGSAVAARIGRCRNTALRLLQRAVAHGWAVVLVGRSTRGQWTYGLAAAVRTGRLVWRNRVG